MKRESREEDPAKSRGDVDLRNTTLEPAEVLRRRLSARRSVLSRRDPVPAFLPVERVNRPLARPDGDPILPLDVRFLVSRGLPRRDAIRATDVAARAGCAPGDVVLAEGLLAPEVYYRWLADELGVGYVGASELVPDPRGREYLPDVEKGRLSILAIKHPGPDTHAVIAPSPGRVGEVILHMARHPEVRARVSVTTPRSLETVRVCAAAVRRLQARWPLASAAFLFTRAQNVALGGAAAGTGGVVWLDALAAFNGMFVASGALFITAGAARMVAAVTDPGLRPTPPVRRRSPLELPRYSVLVPLYREEAVIGELVAALTRIDYPRQHLQILMIVEADDFGTLAALQAARLQSPFEICVVPPLGPRTKPKALAQAMTYARGELITVFDAEDRPEPDQLRKVVARFASASPDLGCVQARLAVDHPEESFFTRHYALEYALQFDVLLPWMAALRLPVRLGGTSNHVKAEALRACGGWDPYNVTEDLDLGIRLLRTGWRISFVDSTTWEEAPLGFRAWIHQRIRWHKGWLQTWAVHMRQPVRFIRGAGLVNAAVVTGMFLGTPLTLVAHPAFLVLLGFYAGDAAWRPSSDSFVGDLVLGVGLACVVMGYGGFYLAIKRAARERGLRFGWREVLGLPFYWTLMSGALVIATVELAIRPTYWRKTKHGVASGRPVSAPLRSAQQLPGSHLRGDVPGASAGGVSGGEGRG